MPLSTLNASSPVLDGRILQVEVITLAFLCPTLYGSLPFVGPAFDSALEDIKLLYPRLNFTQTIVSDNSGSCSLLDFFAVYENLLAEFYFKSYWNRARNYDLTTFVISGADDVIGVANFASELDKLLISSVAFKGQADRSFWVTTSVNSYSTYGKVYDNLIGLFNWSDLALVYDTSPKTNIFFITGALYVRDRLLKSSRNHMTVLTLDSRTYKEGDYRNLLRNVSSVSRVVFYFGVVAQMQAILLAGAQLNMTNGDYVYIWIMPFPVAVGSSFQWTPDGTSDVAAKAASRCLLLIELNRRFADNQTDNFSRKWRQMTKEKYNYTYGPIDVVVDEVREYGPIDALKSGLQLAKFFLNRTFVLKTGKLKLNGKGMNVPYVVVSQTDIESGQVTVVMEEDAETDQLLAVHAVDWPTAWPVLNAPTCGFRGDAVQCRNKSGNQYGLAFGMIAFLVLFFSFGVCACRLQTEQLGNQEGCWWLLDNKELHPVPVNRSYYPTYQQSLLVLMKFMPGHSQYVHPASLN